MSKTSRKQYAARVAGMASVKLAPGFALMQPADYRQLGALLACSPPGTVQALTLGEARRIICHP